MSQSPIDDFSPESVLRYQQGWKALNRLLHEDRSFSGNEKNCAYLNVGDGTGTFANASFVSGLDFADDGRGMAMVDWDFDGDVDLWTTNRTAPRVRFLKNTSAPGKAFVTVRLEGNGTSTNRDAIGARLRLFVQGDAVPRIRTLRTSQGFLSMSSNWIHFGLGDKTIIDRLEIDWPGSGTETVAGLSAGGFFLLKQGTVKATPWLPPVRSERVRLSPSTPDLPHESEVARIPLVARLPCPVLPVQDADGTQSRQLDAELKGPVLVNLWASWCAPCITELSEWTHQADKLTAAGLRVVALNTDALDPSVEPAKNASELLSDLGFPFESFSAHEQAVQSLNLLQRAIVDRWLPLPVPSSFLLDKDGNVAFIYRGPVSVDLLLQDVAALDLPRDARRDRAVPFAGKWTHDPPMPSPLRVASQFIDFTQPQQAVSYLQRYIDHGGGAHLSEGDRRLHHADILYVLGSLLEEGEQMDAAHAAYQRAAALNPADVRIRQEMQRLKGNDNERLANSERQARAALAANPDDPAALRVLAMALVQQKDFTSAAPYFERLVEASPDDAQLRLQWATVLDRSGNAADAVTHYKKALNLDRKTLAAADGIARIRASHPDSALRNGQEALILGQRLCKLTQKKNVQYLDTLAMAYAELGRFDDAIATLRQAISVTPENQALKLRLQLYESAKPFRRENP
ncbi:MAG: tetratricopeptide (TPR) repeat protein [Verrucomicrobiales bacterium]